MQKTNEITTEQYLVVAEILFTNIVKSEMPLL